MIKSRTGRARAVRCHCHRGRAALPRRLKGRDDRATPSPGGEGRGEDGPKTITRNLPIRGSRPPRAADATPSPPRGEISKFCFQTFSISAFQRFSVLHQISAFIYHPLKRQTGKAMVKFLILHQPLMKILSSAGKVLPVRPAPSRAAALNRGFAVQVYFRFLLSAFRISVFQPVSVLAFHVSFQPLFASVLPWRPWRLGGSNFSLSAFQYFSFSP
jgi:hypothetical protein